MDKKEGYQRYSTAFKVQVCMSESKAQFYSMVPASTISSWTKQSFENYLGFELDKQIDKHRKVFNAIVQNKRYANACRGLLLIVSFLNTLINSSKRRNALFRKNKDLVIATFERLKGYFRAGTIEKRLGITCSKISRWKAEGKCALSALRLCLTLNPQQLSLDEQFRFRNFLLKEEHEHLPVNHIWAMAQREGLMMGESTAYKYKNELLGRKEKATQDKKKISIHAAAPFQILHMDSTPLVLKNKEKVYIHFIMDNFSRMILAGVVSHSSKSAVVAENLRGVFKKYKLYCKPITLYSDGGPENEGDVNELLNEKRIHIERVVANYLDETTNNMAEAWHRKFKQVILKIFQVNNSEELIEKLPEMIDYANNLYLPVLKTLSPNEALRGFKYEELKVPKKIQEAKKIRMEINQAFNCKVKCQAMRA